MEELYEIDEDFLNEEELEEKRKRKKKKKKKKKKGGMKDACYHKVKARYDVWPSAYASGALVKCRKVGAANWGNKSKKKNEGMDYLEQVIREEYTAVMKLNKKKINEDEEIELDEENLNQWFKGGGWRQAGGKYDGKPCARQPGQKTTPKCVSSAKRASMSKKERESAQRRKRDTDRNKSLADGLTDKHEGADEVFIYAPSAKDAKKVDQLNDGSGRMVKQQRLSHLKSEGEVNYAGFKDIKMKVANQAADMQK